MKKKISYILFTIYAKYQPTKKNTLRQKQFSYQIKLFKKERQLAAVYFKYILFMYI